MSKPNFVSDKDYEERLKAIQKCSEDFDQSTGLYNRLKENLPEQVNKSIPDLNTVFEADYYSVDNASEFGKTIEDMNQVISNLKSVTDFMSFKEKKDSGATPWAYIEKQIYARVADRIYSSILNIEEACSVLAKSSANAAEFLKAKSDLEKMEEKGEISFIHTDKLTNDEVDTLIDLLKKILKG